MMNYKTRLLYIGIDNKVDIRSFYNKFGNFHWSNYIDHLKDLHLLENFKWTN